MCSCSILRGGCPPVNERRHCSIVTDPERRGSCVCAEVAPPDIANRGKSVTAPCADQTCASWQQRKAPATVRGRYRVAAFLTLPPVTKARPPLLQDSRYTEYPEACDSGPWAAHLAAFARGIASKYFGTMTLVFGEAARISWTKDCKASRLACCEALNGARKLSQ